MFSSEERCRLTAIEKLILKKFPDLAPEFQVRDESDFIHLIVTEQIEGQYVFSLYRELIESELDVNDLKVELKLTLPLYDGLNQYSYGIELMTAGEKVLETV